MLAVHTERVRGGRKREKKRSKRRRKKIIPVQRVGIIMLHTNDAPWLGMSKTMCLWHNPHAMLCSALLSSLAGVFNIEMQRADMRYTIPAPLPPPPPTSASFLPSLPFSPSPQRHVEDRWRGPPVCFAVTDHQTAECEWERRGRHTRFGVPLSCRPLVILSLALQHVLILFLPLFCFF